MASLVITVSFLIDFIANSPPFFLFLTKNTLPKVPLPRILIGMKSSKVICSSSCSDLLKSVDDLFFLSAVKSWKSSSFAIELLEYASVLCFIYSL